MSNAVIHPSHYNHKQRPECWSEMQDKFGLDAVIVFDVMNAYKYFYRHGTKAGNTDEQDIKKMVNYMRHANDLIDEAKSNNIKISDNTLQLVRSVHNEIITNIHDVKIEDYIKYDL